MSTKQTDLVHQPAGPIQQTQPVEPDNPVAVVAGMMKAVLDRGVTQADVSAVEKLTELYERMQAKSAEQEFNRAFVALQREMPKVQATQPVPNNDGTIRYMFAPYESIMEQVQPFLVKHGFTVSFSTRYDQARIVKICTLRHTAGHSVTNEFAVRIGQGPPKASETQADGAAGTYAKRFALCDALNIVCEKDDDARAEGGSISKAQAESLRKRVRASGSDEGAFLRFGKSPVSDNASEAEIIKAYESIPESMFVTLDSNLKRKEKTA